MMFMNLSPLPRPRPQLLALTHAELSAGTRPRFNDGVIIRYVWAGRAREHREAQGCAHADRRDQESGRWFSARGVPRGQRNDLLSWYGPTGFGGSNNVHASLLVKVALAKDGAFAVGRGCPASSSNEAQDVGTSGFRHVKLRDRCVPGASHRRKYQHCAFFGRAWHCSTPSEMGQGGAQIGLRLDPFWQTQVSAQPMVNRGEMAHGGA
jgi:hypothetical protein